MKRFDHDKKSLQDKIKENNEKVKANKQLPYLVSNVVEVGHVVLDIFADVCTKKQTLSHLVSLSLSHETHSRNALHGGELRFDRFWTWILWMSRMMVEAWS
jgi:ATP-dependent 26S proteasome regulatory subunit